MLQSFVKAHSRGIFNNGYQCPYNIEEIEAYVQILKPVYLFSIYMQRSESNIGEVIPFLLKLLQDLSKMTLKGEKKNCSGINW